MIRPAALLLALSLPAHARAQAPVPVHLTFAVYAAGLHVLSIDSDADLGPHSYRVDLSYRSVGLFGVLFPTEINSFVQGSWAGDAADPLRFASWGDLRGETRRTIIDYPSGQPSLTALQPATDPDRDPVPPAMQRDTIDTLSAMAMLIRHLADTGNCDGQTTIFDGRRVSRITAHTAGEERLTTDGRSSFQGEALRCDFQGLQLAGFVHNVSEAELHRPRYSTAWLAQVLPGEPALPVRVVFNTGFFGNATAYLTEASPAGP